MYVLTRSPSRSLVALFVSRVVSRQARGRVWILLLDNISGLTISKISANQHAAFAPVWILYIPARPVDFIDNRPVDWFSKLFEIFFVSAMHSHARRQALPLGGSVMIHIMYNKINRATRFSL